MTEQQVNRTSIKVAIALSLTSLCAVLSGYFQPPQRDEGSAAHIFQLSIVALLPTLLLFLSTAGWKKPVEAARRLALPAATVAFSFGALYYLEHFR
jgi:hypothetical protein